MRRVFTIVVKCSAVLLALAAMVGLTWHLVVRGAAANSGFTIHIAKQVMELPLRKMGSRVTIDVGSVDLKGLLGLRFDKVQMAVGDQVDLDWQNATVMVDPALSLSLSHGTLVLNTDIFGDNGARVTATLEVDLPKSLDQGLVVIQRAEIRLSRINTSTLRDLWRTAQNQNGVADYRWLGRVSGRVTFQDHIDSGSGTISIRGNGISLLGNHGLSGTTFGVVHLKAEWDRGVLSLRQPSVMASDDLTIDLSGKIQFKATGDRPSKISLVARMSGQPSVIQGMGGWLGCTSDRANELLAKGVKEFELSGTLSDPRCRLIALRR